MSKPIERRETGEQDLFRSRLDQMIDMTHELVRLAQKIDWRFLEERFGEVYKDGGGLPPLPTRLMAGLAILKHTFNLSDDAVCARYLDSPYWQYFCGEEFFQHRLPFDRSSMTRWRQRMGEKRIKALLQESLSVAVKTGAMKPADTRQVIVDTTVQPKNVMFPTDAKLIHRARERLVRLANKAGLELRQTYVRVGKFALIQHQRYAHAKQFKRAGKALRKLKTYLGRTVRDIERQIDGDEQLRAIFLWPLYQAKTVMEQKQRQRGRKIYSLHADEVECIGKGKAHKPYEFGVKVSVATTLHRSKGGQFALHTMALPGNPYDGHTLETVIPDMEQTRGNELSRILADAGYRGHNAPESHKFRVFTAGQKRRVTPAIKRQMRRRSAVEPVIGHLKNEHRMDRNYLAGKQGDAVNALLAAVGYNFSLLLKWLRQLLCLIAAIIATFLPKQPLSCAS
ncbi:IS5 family transposase [Rhizobium pusense]|uniref:IS5 family transposase n=2 Tax=Agrobacterium pusense TaxID=648995 RepID=UPI00244A04F9|nr:IS5 family transposase [Agrobacterium pusense]MDH1097815.1 IS5 family transposase [Agrobacterium pusense]MDH1114236.1 IS5 family transposase [Agrobacterium pusense]MDH2196386.1 IS5 family transposase [Agrobacterium pusense]